MTEFDPIVIQEFATNLINRSRRIRTGYTIRYGFIGFLLGLGFGLAVISEMSESNEITLIIASLTALGLTFGSLLGRSAGKVKVSTVTLEAHKLLLDLKIEQNTRNLNHPSKRKNDTTCDIDTC